MELLLPAGAPLQLKAAVQSGADAVYIGGERFGARHGSQNFSNTEMKDAIDYAHAYGADVHVTVNTLIKEKEIEAVADYLFELNDMGADALIIQDIGVARLARRIIPEMPLHASTQMTVTSAEGVKYLEDMGFSRVVLARELSKDEIRHICKNSSAEIEVFVHGAICMCYSGQCLMSSVLGGRSGNRGRCAQPCRLFYSLTENGRTLKDGYLLSPKDMALINELQTLKEIGVKSLKVEGRLKRPEYVSAVAGVYRKYLNLPAKVSEQDMKELKNAFSRTGFTDGYFTGNLGKKMMSFNNPSNAPKNTYTKAALLRAQENANIRKVPVGITASFFKDSPVEITMYDGDGNYACGRSDALCENAQGKPIQKERVTAQLEKLGQTIFVSTDTDVFLDSNVTVPISAINEARRRAAENLYNMRISRPSRKKKEFEGLSQKQKKRTAKLVCAVKTKEQAKAAQGLGIKDIYAPKEIAEELGLITAAEPIFCGEDINTNGVLIENTASLIKYKDKEIYGGSRLNAFNSMTVNEMERLKSVTLSPELNLAEIDDIKKHTDKELEVTVYGKIGLMLMKNCPIKAAGKCQNGKNIYKLKDRKNEEFELVCRKNCVCELLNSKPIFMADKIDALLGIDRLRLEFTTETKAQCRRIIQLYQDALLGKTVKNPFGENHFTRGHFYRGVL